MHQRFCCCLRGAGLTRARRLAHPQNASKKEEGGDDDAEEEE